MKVKKLAFTDLFSAAFGTPVQVVQGYIKKIKIDIPWNKILSAPVEVWLDDLHVILKSSEKYDRNFVKKQLNKLKKKKVDELLKKIKVSLLKAN